MPPENDSNGGSGVKARRWGWVAALLGFLCVVVMPAAVARFVWEQLPPPKDVSAFAAVFGDIVGPLFAALAFAGLIYTALMQREELGLQREELRETRAELRRTADAQEASEKALQAQVEASELTARLNAATALLGYYTNLMPPGGLVIATTPDEKAVAETFSRETEHKIKDVLNEIISLRDKLNDVVRFEAVVDIPFQRNEQAPGRMD